MGRYLTFDLPTNSQFLENYTRVKIFSLLIISLSMLEVHGLGVSERSSELNNVYKVKTQYEILSILQTRVRRRDA